MQNSEILPNPPDPFFLPEANSSINFKYNGPMTTLENPNELAFSQFRNTSYQIESLPLLLDPNDPPKVILEDPWTNFIESNEGFDPPNFNSQVNFQNF